MSWILKDRSIIRRLLANKEEYTRLALRCLQDSETDLNHPLYLGTQALKSGDRVLCDTLWSSALPEATRDLGSRIHHFAVLYGLLKAQKFVSEAQEFGREWNLASLVSKATPEEALSLQAIPKILVRRSSQHAGKAWKKPRAHVPLTELVIADMAVKRRQGLSLEEWVRRAIQPHYSVKFIMERDE